MPLKLVVMVSVMLMAGGSVRVMSTTVSQPLASAMVTE